jgi:uncharacterized membrane protein YfcA
MTLLLAAVAAFVAAAINSVAGGGTFLTFPVLTGPLALSEKVANMTSTIGLWPGSASSIYAARTDIRRIPTSQLFTFGIISVIGGVLGAQLLRWTDQKTFRLVIPWLLAFATLVFAFSKPIAKWAGAKHGHRTPFWTLVVACIQLLVAVYGGYFGAGIGVLMLAGLSFAGLDDIRQMNALKVLLATIINGVAAAVFLYGSLFGDDVDGRINWPIGAAMALSAAVGGFLGMAVAQRMPQVALRVVVLLVGTALTVIYFVRAYGG